MDQTDRLTTGVPTPVPAAALTTPFGLEREAVSWGAILAGAFAMAAFSLILLTLGTGLGLTSISPWQSSGVHAKTFGGAVVIWVIVTQIMAGGLGGYLAGRMRRHWPRIGTEETHFRDTVHGFLAWCVATIVTALLLTSAVSGIARSAASVASQTEARMVALNGALDRGNAQAAYQIWPLGYMIDGLLRPVASAPASANVAAAPPATANTMATSGDHADATIATIAEKQEIARIFLNSLPARGALSPEDTAYVSQIVARQTGLTPADAQARVTTTWTRLVDKVNALDTAARAAADEARRVTIHATLWLFVSLLIGAFSASFMATIGGRMREF
ncbi:hypothetical protein [Paraburkholderia acidisoli]|uniref:Transmembrane protein n=1 Tax=Paraburkholderia acidisoli TaxID=2571748 RepID=A0A7Z2GRK5_9BURK|nr:hypothetical protein [Paraburkholderia acidisoli]QGZ66506.1 hypothetical protein FAZ98_32540 [Paraburkholderia acidisoli]